MSSRDKSRGRGRGRGRGQARGRAGQHRDETPTRPGSQSSRSGQRQQQTEEVRPGRQRTHREEHSHGSGAMKTTTSTTEKTKSTQATSTGPSTPLPLQPLEGPIKQSKAAQLPATVPVQSSQQRNSGSVAPSQPKPKPIASAIPVTGNEKPKGGPQNFHGKQQPPDRPGVGTKGREISLRANFFPIHLPPHLTIHQYDVSFTPTRYSKSEARIVYEELVKQHRDVFGGQRAAFDGSKLVFSSRPLRLRGDAQELEVSVELEGRQKVFKVAIKKVNQLNIDVANLQKVLSDVNQRGPLLQAIDVALRHIPSLHMFPVGRSFFSPSASSHPLGQGREVWLGHYKSLKPISGWKLVLNVDTAATAFYTEQSVIDFLCAVRKRVRDSLAEITQADRNCLIGDFERGKIRDADRAVLSKEIKGLKIEVTHLPYPRKWKVNRIMELPARKQTFKLDNGTQVTVENYFKETYKDKKLCHPLLPCLHVGPPTRTIYIPMEFCKIVKGQRCVKRLTEQQKTQMIRSTATPAYQRERDIKRIASDPSIRRDPIANEFGIRIDSRMMEIHGRVLPPPTLLYNKEVTPPPDKGSWEMRHSDAKLHEGANVRSWAVIVCAEYCREGDVTKFVDGLVCAGRSMGMSMNGSPQCHYVQRCEKIESVFDRVYKKTPKLRLIVAIIDKMLKYQYQEVKHIGDNQVGVITQCVLSETVQKKCFPPTLANICLKINGKLGGINNVIAERSRLPLFLQEPVIVFGADVTHPRSGDTVSPSIASVVASIDCTASKYMAKHHAQKNRQEIIARLKDMVRELLLAFRRSTDLKPTRIIFYRDGVSEGQFEDVRYNEVAAIQQACLSLNQEYRPPITFLVVQKRHHTRLFPTSPNDATGKGKNVPPGTTVDREITHPKEFDFYLCSHAAIQGTSRPCHYHILWDDSDFTANAIQMLSYQLCHMFWRCNRSVSYPAPTYYAHHDAARARVLLQALEGQQGSSESGSTVGSRSSDEAVRRANELLQEQAIEIHENIRGSMYYI